MDLGAACSIRGTKDAPKYKEFILPLIFAKRLCDVYDDELNRIANKVGSRAKALRLVNRPALYLLRKVASFKSTAHLEN
jgi:type I restriction-modification system DNA methylase subunit